MSGKITESQLEWIKSAPPDTPHTVIAMQFGVSPQYISQVRRGVGGEASTTARPEEPLLSKEASEAQLQAVRGSSTMVQKRAQAADDLMDCVLLALDDLKRTRNPDRREKRISVLARSLRDIAEATTVLRGVGTLSEMTDEDVKAALLVITSEPEPKELSQ